MNGKDFIRAVSNGKADVLQMLLVLLRETNTPYCIVGGLAVNAYAEPVVSLDVDVVVLAGQLAQVRQAALAKGLKIEEAQHTVTLSRPDSDLRIQLQTDPRYQAILCRAEKHTVLGYELMVAALGDVLHWKLWAHADPRRRKSKRQKDLADILRLIETHPELKSWLPPKLLAHVD